MIHERIIHLAYEVMEISQIGLAIQRDPGLAIELKDDQTPVTPADKQMEARLVAELSRFNPRVPILAEEGSGTQEIDLPSAVQTGLFSVDPLDGTFSFTAGMPGWSVSVAYLEGGQPHFGIVAQPARGLYFAAERGQGVWQYSAEQEDWLPHTRKLPAQQKFGLDLDRSLADDGQLWRLSRRMVQAYRSPIVEPAVSQGLQIVLGNSKCWLAPDLKHWDVAATALLVEECGGVAETLDGRPISWEKLHTHALLFSESRAATDHARGVMKLF